MKNPVSRYLPLLLAGLAFTALGACDGEGWGDGDYRPPTFGKADGESIVEHDYLLFGGADVGEFATDTEYHVHGVYVWSEERPVDFTLHLEAKGTDEEIFDNLIIWVFGPAPDEDTVGPMIAEGAPDIVLEEIEAGNYTVVVGTKDGEGRGTYRVELKCHESTQSVCGPIPDFEDYYHLPEAIPEGVLELLLAAERYCQGDSPAFCSVNAFYYSYEGYGFNEWGAMSNWLRGGKTGEVLGTGNVSIGSFATALEGVNIDIAELEHAVGWEFGEEAGYAKTKYECGGTYCTDKYYVALNDIHQRFLVFKISGYYTVSY